MEETDYQGPSRELERETDEARQDIGAKVSDQGVPGIQDEQEDVLGGRKAVEERQREQDDGEGEEEGEDGSEGEEEGEGSSEDEE